MHTRHYLTGKPVNVDNHGLAAPAAGRNSLFKALGVSRLDCKNVSYADREAARRDFCNFL